MPEFIQQGPVLKNQFSDDLTLKAYLSTTLPESYHKVVFEDLTRFGHDVTGEILDAAKSAEEHPPRHVPFDAWGNRIDKIETDPGWRKLHFISAREKMISMAYKKPYGVHSRVIQFAKLYLFHPSSAFYTCPLAMSDGAAKLIELYGDEELKSRAFQQLISDEPEQFWTSGQWMTEKSGGSDVSNTETIARFIDGQWQLTGTKWFSSAITADMAMALAKTDDECSGLSLFYVELKNPDGTSNGIEILRLKDKLGTHALPTAEIKLKATKAKLVGVKGAGVKQIASMFNVTRLYNSVTSIAAFRRFMVLAEDYASKRVAFKKNIGEHPLTAALLNEARSQFLVCFYFTFLATEIFGLEEVNADLEAAKLIRLITPVLKLYTGKKVVYWSSELLEVFGGVGYIEDSGIPRLLRDNQVFPIWEGTTNVLSLDLLRALKKDQSWDILLSFMNRILNEIKKEDLQDLKKEMQKKMEDLNQWKKSLLNLEEHARNLSFKLGDLIGVLAWLRQLERNEKTDQQEMPLIKTFIQSLK